MVDTYQQWVKNPYMPFRVAEMKRSMAWDAYVDARDRYHDTARAMAEHIEETTGSHEIDFDTLLNVSSINRLN